MLVVLMIYINAKESTVTRMVLKKRRMVKKPKIFWQSINRLSS